MIQISFHNGTLLLQSEDKLPEPLLTWCIFDERAGGYRARALHYAPIVSYLFRNKIPYEDLARNYARLNLKIQSDRSPRSYQQEGLEAWKKCGGRGVVVLPTGTGKSFLAQMVIQAVGRSCLVVVPTIDLMEQWTSQLEKSFGMKTAMLGGGSHDIGPITVSTYDSAVPAMEFHGNEFGLLVVDECHHLPGACTRRLAEDCLAPYRLGLSATPERPDGENDCLDELLGPICYRREIDELEGQVLAPYDTEQIPIYLDPDEFELYQKYHSQYIDFIHRNNIRLGSPAGWKNFLIACCRMPDGSACLKAYLQQRKIAQGSRAKLRMIWELLQKHFGERIIIFTADNATAYKIGGQFLLPVLTHHTKAEERHDYLEAFRSGLYPCLVTSKVLNEGVDVPEASVGIVVSGSGSIREHVQRLGRILRPSAGKRAVLYELVSIETSEYYVSERRRQHRAYERADSLQN